MLNIGRLSLVVSVLITLASCGGSNTQPAASVAPPQTLAITIPPPAASGPSYQFIQGTGPVVILLDMSAQQSLYTTLMGTIPTDLQSAGFTLLSMDVPCHGADADPGYGDALQCWRHRLETGDTDMFLRFCAQLSQVLDEIGAKDVSVVGQSRGGYVAATCAAGDPRIKRLALIAPVTDLMQLEEFQGAGIDQTFFSLDQYKPDLVSDEILVRIGNDDTTVGTAAAVHFGTLVGADMEVVDVPGHVPPDNGATTLWLQQHIVTR
jgi:pimeloyl-ACP methyl ester carboxylesterase